jgi:hypothetical protein
MPGKHVPIEPGTRFGKWTVIERIPNKNNVIYYSCRCDCGKQEAVISSNLRNTSSPSCRSCAQQQRHKPVEPGTKFGKWQVIKFSHRNKAQKVYYVCVCECGVEKSVVIDSLIYGKSQGCHKCSSYGRHKEIEAGTKFGNWTIMDKPFERNSSHICYWCKCICGVEKLIQGTNLITGHSSSCSSCSRMKYEITSDDGTTVFTPAQKELYSSYKKGAENRGLHFELSAHYFKIITSKPCIYCGVPPMQSKKANKHKYTYNGIDRVDNSIGYTVSNCVPCCGTCNYAKRAMPYSEWMAYIKRLTQHQNRKAKRHTPQSNVYQSQMTIN